MLNFLHRLQILEMYLFSWSVEMIEPLPDPYYHISVLVEDPKAKTNS